MGLGSESLITEVRDLLGGRLVIPSIQRGYVWQRPQVPHLLDSLYRGYPVGSLLLWKTTMEVPLRQASVLQEAQHQLHPAILLDGQQRLTSLAKVFAPEKIVGGPLDVRFDIDSQTFLNPSGAQKSPRLVRVTALMADDAQFSSILRDAGVTPSDPDYDEIYSRARRVHAIRDYRIPVITVESDDYEEVAEIFARVNQGGRRLSKGDLVYSAIGARWPEGLDTIDAFNADLASERFALDREAVLRLMGLLAGSGAHAIKLINKSMSGTDLKSAWAETERALKLGIDFLKGECGIPRAAVLTSPNVVVTPSLFLYRRGSSISAHDIDSLRRWVYTAMAFSHYSNQVEGKLDIEARLIREQTGEALWDELLRRASGARPVGAKIEGTELASRTYSSSWFNLLYIAALRRQAKDWHSHQALAAAPMTSSSKIEYHHVFPKARVEKDHGRAVTNNIANLAFISGATNRKISAALPVDYLAKVPVEHLADQWVPSDPRLWALEAFPQFLAARQELLAKALNDLLGLTETRAAGDEPADDELYLEDDDVEFDRPAGTGRRPGGAIAAHIAQCFAGRSADLELTVQEIKAMPSDDYDSGEVSAGALSAALDAGRVPGFTWVPGSSPRRVRQA
ncbi:GmrSD restriction endonuclease domain-containing protein [Knoellia sp. CPCC 206435]|uniref:GmrSD restriction endonuclease domain-containing protein n=1 Tax=Knoellia terrae TaxID=3404797 RepID=UPI003B433B86